MEIERRTARAVIINPAREILLLSVKLPWMHGATWMLPGGGIEAGESAEECVRREIFEETGLQYSGDLVLHWHGTTEFCHQEDSYRVHEQYFLARVQERFEPTTAQMMDYERDSTLDITWRNLEQISKPSNYYSPRQIPRMFEQVERGTLPITSEQITDVMPANYIGRSGA